MSSTSTLRLQSGHQVVELRSGTLLECMVTLAPASAHADGGSDDGPRSKLSVCLHPWSWLGGRMDDPVLQTLVKPLHKRGYDVLRYNSRGVGNSSGWSSLTGTREAQDLQELVQWAVTQNPALESVVLIGYSYGSLIASLHPLLPNLRISHVLLSYPLGPRHWLTAFHSKSYTNALNALIHDLRAYVLVLYGDHDEFSSVENYDAWAEGLLQEADGKENLSIHKIDGATHFWRERGAVQRLIEVIEEWLP